MREYLKTRISELEQERNELRDIIDKPYDYHFDRTPHNLRKDAAMSRSNSLSDSIDELQKVLSLLKDSSTPSESETNQT